MRISWILLLVVGVVLISYTEANWFKKSIGKVKNWVKKHCSINIPGGVRCGFGRKKRSVDYAFGPWQTPGLENAQLPSMGPWRRTGDESQRLSSMGGPWPNAGGQGQPLPPTGSSSNAGGQDQQQPYFPNWQQNSGSGLPDFRAAPQSSSLDPETGFDCNSAFFPVSELSRQIFDEAFRETDENEDELMDNQEANTLLTTLKIVENCVQKQNEMKRKK